MDEKPDSSQEAGITMTEKRMSSNSYPALLQELVPSHPRVAALLDGATRTRNELLQGYKSGVRLAGVECLFAHLEVIKTKFETHDKLARLAFLAERAECAFHACLEAGLAGYLAIAADTMRAVMEIEFLLREFAATPSAAAAWLGCSDSDRQRQFSPNRLRQLRANRLGISVNDLRDHSDYKAHSLLLHVVPQHQFPVRRIRLGETNPWQDAFFWELFEHARRYLEAVDELMTSLSVPWGASGEREDLVNFRRGWNRVTEWREILDALRAEPAAGQQGNED